MGDGFGNIDVDFAIGAVSWTVARDATAVRADRRASAATS